MTLNIKEKLYARCILGLLCALFTFTACNKDEQDPLAEDYDALFPFEGIEDYEDEDGAIIIRNEDPFITKKTFEYKGEEGIFDPTDYEVVLRYRYDDKNAVQTHAARYLVRFVNEAKQLVSISSNKNTHYMDPIEYEELNGAKPPQDYEMESGKDYEIRFKVKSGHQILLCVNGAGPRNTSMKASLTATPLDDSSEPIVLQTEQYQNDEGQVMLPYPYCKYVVLP